MSDPADNFRINLNQNLWGLVVSFSFLGGAEYYDLSTLYWLALIPATVMIISVCCTTFSYTNNYIKSKRS